MKVEIKEVLTAREYLSFVKFAEELYKNEPNWVCPLRSDELSVLRRDKNPSYEYCLAKLFLAYCDGKVVGRVAAIVNHKSNAVWNEKRLRFGWFDFIDDYSVSEALIAKVEEWAYELGMEKVSGPQGFNDMDKQGLLVEGFEKRATANTLHNFAYYLEHLERLGYCKEVDWIQRVLTVPELMPEKIAQFSEIVKERYGLRILEKVSKKELYRYAVELFETYNKAFSSLYCFSPLSVKEYKLLVKQFVPVLNQDMVVILLDKNNQLAAFAITMPSIAVALQKAKGRLFPFGFIHLKKALANYEEMEMNLIGALPEYRNKGVNAIIFHQLNIQYVKYGVKKLVSYPMLENNESVQRIFDYYPMAPYMRRRCLVKHINKSN